MEVRNSGEKEWIQKLKDLGTSNYEINLIIEGFRNQVEENRDYLQELEKAFHSWSRSNYKFNIVVVPMSFFHRLERQLISNNSFMFNFVNQETRLYGRRVIGSPHTDKIEFY